MERLTFPVPSYATQALRHHVTGAIERGQAVAIVEQRAPESIQGGDPLQVGELVQLNGYSNPRGWIVSVVAQASETGADGARAFVFGATGLVRAPAFATVRIVWQDGREETDCHFDPATLLRDKKDNRIHVYRVGSVDPAYAANVAAARAALAVQKEAARVALEASTAAGRAECARLSAMYPGALVIAGTGPESAGRFALGADGSVSVWTHGGHTARTYRPGDTIRHGAYNFDYTGTMTRATAKTVFFTEYGKATKISAEKFYGWNVDFCLERSAQRRAEWSD